MISSEIPPAARRRQGTALSVAHYKGNPFHIKNKFKCILYFQKDAQFVQLIKELPRNFQEAFRPGERFKFFALSQKASGPRSGA